MGFFLSVLYLVISYLTPEVLFGRLAAAHIELILAALIFAASVPTIVKSFALKTPQSLALVGLAFAVILSVIFGMGWVGGGIRAFLGFVPNALGYFFVCLHCNTKKKLQALVAMMLFVCLFVIAKGSFDLLHGVPPEGPPIIASYGSFDGNAWDVSHPYLFAMRNDSGEWIYRLRGLGFINDPNDFGQMVVCVMPLMFIFWKPKRIFRNIAFVLLPTAVLLGGLLLTHSRGGLLALIAVLVVAARRRIGTIPALVLAAMIFSAAMALQFTGGRGISADAGEDRTALWGESLQLLKTHPLFGVGFGNLPDYLGHTAHNSVAVCAGELGLVGLFFWTLFLLPTLRDTVVVASPLKVSDGGSIEPVEEEYPLATNSAVEYEVLDKAEINRLGRLMVLSLTGYLVAGWFLSRAFILTLFVLGGMAEVIFQMALQQGMIAPRWRLKRVLPYSAVLAVAMLVGFNILLRIVNLMH
jgi:hypothetical protein